MRYRIPGSPQEIQALQEQPISGEVVATAITGVIQIARAHGQTLDELTAQVMADDGLLDVTQRRWLNELVTHAWQRMQATPIEHPMELEELKRA